MDLSQLFKIRASASGEILGGITKPTEKQLERISFLENKVKITDKQKEELKYLKKKRDSKPELQQGAKTYCEKWIKEQLYERTLQFSNKYTEKGILCESDAIKLVADIMDYPFASKNEKFFEDEDMTGTPDLILPTIVEDIKNSWNIYTFPLFDTELPNTDYYYQLQCYMALTGLRKAAVNYCLIDAPDEIIEQEARRISFKAGYNEVDMELYDEVYAKMTYKNIPQHLKHKRFEFERDDVIIESIRAQVKLCRKYIKELTTSTLLIATGDTINGKDIIIINQA